MDDLPAARPDDLEQMQFINGRLLASFKRHGIPAVGFVNEQKLEATTAQERDARHALLARWVADGHVLGNHTYSHRGANVSSVEEYLAEIDKGEVVTRRLMAYALARLKGRLRAAGTV